MTAAGMAGKLYTPELLSLATELATYPLDGSFGVTGNARSRTCGSHLTVGFATDGNGNVIRIGLAVTACAVGQAAAAIFARSASGLGAADMAQALAEIEAWIADGRAPLPRWPGFAAIEPAREYPGRHGAMILPWKAAVDALCKAENTG